MFDYVLRRDEYATQIALRQNPLPWEAQLWHATMISNKKKILQFLRRLKVRNYSDATNPAVWMNQEG